MTRIYLVKNTENGGDHLVRAHNQAQAVRHVARKQFECEVASQDDLVELVASGVKVEDAGADDVMPASQSGLVNNQ